MCRNKIHNKLVIKANFKNFILSEWVNNGECALFTHNHRRFPEAKQIMCMEFIISFGVCNVIQIAIDMYECTPLCANKIDTFR